MKLSWELIQSVSVNNTPRFVSLSPLSVALIGACYSFLRPDFFWQFDPDDDEGNVALKDQIQAAVANLMLEVSRNMLIGSVMPYIVFPPAGTLPCDGSTHNREDHPLLYEYLILTGLIIDADTFRTPTIQDRFVIATGPTFTQFAMGGSATHTLTQAEMPVHSHSESVVTTTLSAIGEIPSLVATGGVGATGNAGSGAAHNNMPPYVSLPYCIVAG